MSMLVVLVVLLFTFKSAGMPVLLIVVIEGCIWINFSYPTLMNKPIFFIGYLIVSSIQMGANIDYAIVVSSRYQEVKKLMPQKEAIIDSMNFAFPTIVTSGTMMAVAGILIGQLTSDPCICGIGQALGRGTIISIITVLFVLPQILLLGDKIIDKTSFDVNLSLPIQTREMTGLVRVDGVVRGAIDGNFVGTMHGVIRGNVNVQMVTGSMSEADSFDMTKAIEMEEAVFSQEDYMGEDGQYDGASRSADEHAYPQTERGRDTGDMRQQADGERDTYTDEQIYSGQIDDKNEGGVEHV